MNPKQSPRKVRYRNKSGCLGIWGIRLFILPHTLVGLGVALMFLFKISLGLFGSRVDGRFESEANKLNSKGKSFVLLKYSFFANQERHIAEVEVSESRNRMLKEKAFLPIVYLSILPSKTSQIMEPDKIFPPDTWMAGGFALFWNSILSVFVYAIYISPYRKKRLLMYGVETSGQVTTCSSYRGSKGGTRYSVAYFYMVDGVKYEDAENVYKSQFENTHEGMTLRIIYDPTKPQRSTAVQLSYWEIVG
jgi:hypothetical protein